MLDEYRIEPISVGQYLDGVNNEDTKIDQAVQRSFCWSYEMMNSLIYSALSRKIFIPNLILAEEKRNDGTKQTYVVDGGQRTETLYRFKYCGYKITNNLRSYMVPYRRKKVDENGNYVRDEYGNIECEMVEFDIRKKTYNDLPQELKSKFDGCTLTTVIYQDCTKEETSELVLLYNNHVGMNASQKSLTYIGKYAEEIKRIKDTNRFLKDGTVLTEKDKKNGTWERVISESVMGINHFDSWKKTPKDMCDYLNMNSSEKEYLEIEKYFNRLIPYSDKIKNNEVASLFTSKNLFVWMMVFDRFTKLGFSDDKFGEFLNVFISELKFRKKDGKDWECIDSDRHTKDKSLIIKKVEYLEWLMKEFLHKEAVSRESLLAETINMDQKTLHDNLDFYEECLNDLTDRTIKYGSKLLDKQNKDSLLLMFIYSFENNIDIKDWLTEYASKNNTYFIDTKENFLHMRKDFDQYCERHKLKP